MNEEIRARMEKLNTMKSEGGGKFYVWCDNHTPQIATDLDRLLRANEVMREYLEIMAITKNTYGTKTIAVSTMTILKADKIMRGEDEQGSE